ncbi:hypothetical protein HDU67_001203 [Dinochytrium kinnereticum]|nr:hypothetical protein HDU67_001203 [Dinochytrium kinnereticum]
MRVVYSAAGVRDYRIAGLSASQDYVFGFFEVCTAPTPGVDPPDPTMPGQISSRMECWTYKKICEGVRFQTSFDPGPVVDLEFCGPRWRTAVAMEIIAAALGTLVILLLIDNALVWLNRSCWYHPKRHLVSEVDCVRRTFKVVVILTVLGHGAFQAFAMGILFDLQRHRIKWPTGLDFHWGIFLQGISWVADVVFVLLFLFFDRLTFFVNVEWEDEEDEVGEVGGGGVNGVNGGGGVKGGDVSTQPYASVHVGGDQVAVLGLLGGSRIDAVAVQVIRGEMQ